MSDDGGFGELRGGEGTPDLRWRSKSAFRSWGASWRGAGLATKRSLTPVELSRQVWGWAVVLPAILLLALFGLAACRPIAQPPASPPLTGSLRVEAPAEAPAGEAVTVTIRRPDAADGAEARLVATGSYGPAIYRAAFTGGAARFVLPAEETRRSGAVRLTAEAGRARGTAELRLLPGPPVEPLTPLVGGRSIPADAAHWSMAVIVPFDHLENPVAEGTPVHVQALHPGGRLVAQTVPVRHLLAWARIASGTIAGRTTISVVAGDAHGPDAILLEVAGWPMPFGVTFEPAALPADGRQLMTLRTGVLQDRFDNIVPDGTLVAFVVEAPDGGRRTITAPTLRGVAEATLQAPATPATLVVWGTVYGTGNAPAPAQLPFTDGPAVGRHPVTMQTLPDRHAIQFRAGPLLGPQNQYIPDGSEVTFRVTGPAGVAAVLRAVAERGYAEAELRLVALAVGSYSVETTAGAGRGSAYFAIR